MGVVPLDGHEPSAGEIEKIFDEQSHLKKPGALPLFSTLIVSEVSIDVELSGKINLT